MRYRYPTKCREVTLSTSSASWTAGSRLQPICEDNKFTHIVFNTSHMHSAAHTYTLEYAWLWRDMVVPVSCWKLGCQLTSPWAKRSRMESSARSAYDRELCKYGIPKYRRGIVLEYKIWPDTLKYVLCLPEGIVFPRASSTLVFHVHAHYHAVRNHTYR